jgi:hypothetical protein
MATPQIGSHVRVETGDAAGRTGYFQGVTGHLYAVLTPQGTIGVAPDSVVVTHIPGYMAEKGDEIRYYAMRANAIEWAGEGYMAVVPALVPVGATMHDVFDSLEDFDASKPATA